MVARQEVDALVAERVWQETEKALREPAASAFFKVLRECGALERIYPELDALFGVPQPPRWHPEIDTGVHTLMVLDQAVKLSAETRVRFAALVHDLGKGTTPPAEWPSHRGHEERSVALIESLAARLRIPGDYRELALIVARYHGIVHRAFELKARNHRRIPRAGRCDPAPGAVCASAARVRGGLARAHRIRDRPYPQRDYLLAARAAAASIKPSARRDRRALRRQDRGAAARPPPAGRRRGARTIQRGHPREAAATGLRYRVCRRSLSAKPRSAHRTSARATPWP